MRDRASVVRLLVAAGVTAAGLAAVPALGAPAASTPPPAGFWVAGDLHVHSIYGHDTCVGPRQAWDETSTDRSARVPCEEPWVTGFAPVRRYQDARLRGLDFLALTDHNNVVNQSDPAAQAWLRDHPQFIAVPAYENSQPGHVQMLGARSCISNSGPTGGTIACNRAVTDQSAAGEQALADALRAVGGAFQINHPSDGDWDTRYGHAVVPDTVEVWNTGIWAYQPPFPAANNNDVSLRWYDEFLRAGHEVAITGGSDSHWVTTSAVQGIGEPTTWVYVTERSTQAVLDGLRAHRTFVSVLPPALAGPQLFLEADAAQDGVFEALAGSRVAPGATFRARVANALPGSVLRIATDRGQTIIPLRGEATLTFRPGHGGIPAASTFVRAELLHHDAQAVRTQTCEPLAERIGSTACTNKLAMLALSSPIYVR